MTVRNYLGRSAEPTFSGIPAAAVFSGNILVCEDCGHGWMQFMPSESALVAYYRETYWNTRVSIGKDSDSPHFRRRAESQFQFVKPFLPTSGPLEMLEIGAGPAVASRQFREALGSRVVLNVCEPGAEWAQYYLEQNIARVAEFFPFASPKPFHYLHASHWLEHMVNLDMTIANLREMTLRGGFLFIEVPNAGHDYWDLGITGTPHTHFFSLASLRAVFVKGGYNCVDVGEFGLTMRAWHGGAKPGDGDYSSRAGGMWLRALFKRPLD